MSKKSTLSSGEAIKYFYNIHRVRTNYMNMRNYIIKGRRGITLKASKSGRRFVLIASDIDKFIKLVGATELRTAKRGRPTIQD